MKIAIVGSRGIPARYGGFETCAEEVGAGLAAKGHSVLVYCCRPYTVDAPSVYRGVRRIVLPAVRVRSAEKFVYTLLSLLHATRMSVDVVLVLGVAGALGCWIPRFRGMRVVVNVDGLEWRRRKWGPLVAACLRLSERAACTYADAIVTDARYIQAYYWQRHRTESVLIPYGVDAERIEAGETLELLGLQPGNYVLYVSRLEPENNPLLVSRAFSQVRSSKRLVIVGGSAYPNDYLRELYRTTDQRISFPGGIYGRGYRELQSHAYVYVQATEVGGTHPALVEAIGYGHCVIANDVPEHREVLGDAAVYYNGTEAGLCRALQEVLDSPEIVWEYRSRAAARASLYSWTSVVDEYERLLSRVASGVHKEASTARPAQ